MLIRTALAVTRRMFFGGLAASAGLFAFGARAQPPQGAKPAGRNDTVFLKRALALAQTGNKSGAGPAYGAVIVLNGKIIGEGWNKVRSKKDPTAHAEIVAIQNAAKKLGQRALSRCILYASSAPCPMCETAAYWANVERIVYPRARTQRPVDVAPRYGSC